MAQKLKTLVGIEYDTHGIRAARVSAKKRGKYIQHAIDKLEEIHGSFKDEKELIDGLKKIKSKLSVGYNDNVITCLSGKQIYVGQIPFRVVPNSEMRSALKFEVRKHLTFEASSATLDYQVLEEAGKKEDESTVLVVASANLLLDKHLRNLGKAGIKPTIVDVLPLAISNVLWRESIEKEYGTAFAMIHISPTVCTIVFDGSEISFYTRSIYFSADEIFGEENGEVAEAEQERRLKSFGDEIKRSLSFYEKTYRVPKFSECYLLGEYVTSSKLIDFFKDEVGLDIKYSEFAEVYHENIGADKGKFDVAVALGMRTE